MKLEKNLFVIGGAIYVIGMFIVFYYYQYQGVVNPGAIAFVSIFGALLVLSQTFFATSNDVVQKEEQKSKA